MTKGSQTALGTPKVDVHTHIYPDFYAEAVRAAGHTPGPDGNPAAPTWNVSLHLDFMAANNIEKSIVSCSSPETNLYADDVAANILLTQQFNNHTAELKREHPDKFGFFASLPLTEINALLKEVDRAMDELDADGFVYLSNYFGLYHGDPKLQPIYEKINARGAVIFIHPAMPCPVNAPTNVSGTARLDWVAPLMNDYGVPTLEFLFDTTRTLSDLVLTGTAEVHSNIRWIIPHCGSVLVLCSMN